VKLQIARKITCIIINNMKTIFRIVERHESK